MSLNKDKKYKRNYELYKTLKHKKEFTPIFLKITAKLCENYITNYEFWNSKRLITIYLIENEKILSKKMKNKYLKIYNKNISEICFSDIDFEVSKNVFLECEIEWIKRCLNINSKNFQIWNYIEFFIDYTKFSIFKFEILEKIFTIYPKNIHAWTLVTKMILRFQEFKDGFMLTERFIRKDCMNNSAWNCRYYLFKETYRGNMNCFYGELSFLSYFIDEKNDSTINYLFGLAQIENIKDILIEINNSLNNEYFTLKLRNYVTK